MLHYTYKRHSQQLTMSPTAETLIPQRRPVSEQFRHSPTFNGTAVPHKAKSTASHTRYAVKENSRMKMRSSEDTLTISESDLRLQFFHKEPCLYSHQTYVNAGKIFTRLKHETLEEKDSPYLKRKNQEALSQKVQEIQLNFKDDQEKRRAFELAFTALKCKYMCIIYCVFSAFWL